MQFHFNKIVFQIRETWTRLLYKMFLNIFMNQLLNQSPGKWRAHAGLKCKKSPIWGYEKNQGNLPNTEFPSQTHWLKNSRGTTTIFICIEHKFILRHVPRGVQFNIPWNTCVICLSLWVWLLELSKNKH